jgi:hypothetical protein
MSDMKNFDDFLNAQLSKHSSEVPSRIWDNIVAERNKRKPSPFWLGFLTNRNMFLLAGLLFAGGAGIAILSTPTNTGNTATISSGINNRNTTNTNRSSSNISTTNKLSSDNNNNNNQSSDQIAYSASSLLNSTRSNTIESNTTTGADKNRSYHTTNNNSLKSISVDAQSKNDNISNHKAKRYFIAGVENMDVVPANSIDVRSDNNDLAANSTKNDYSSNHTNSSNNNDNYNDIASSPVATKHAVHHHNASGSAKSSVSKTDNDAITDNDPIEKSDDLSSTNNNTNKIQFFPQGYLSNRLKDSAQKIAMPVIAIADIVTKLNLPECPTVEKDIAGNKQYIEAYISPDYGIRTLTDSSKSNNSAYLQQRKQSTGFSTAFSAGFRYTKVLKSGISVAAGLNYSQINERFTVAENIFLIETHYDNRGNIIGTDTVSGKQYKTTHNHYHSVDVPLLLGYEMGNDRIHINVNAGPIMNIYSWQHGELLSQDSIPESISSGKSSSLADQYKTNIGLGITGGVSVFYKLNDQLHIFAEPYFRYNFGSMNNSQSPIQQKYTTVGLHVGLRLDIK